jgi:HD superfamily phosphohydrolase
LIVSAPIAGVLERDWGLDPARVADLLRSEPLGGIDGLLQDVLSGALDVDKLDYLVRDARHCNVPYGEVDVDRIVEELSVYEDGTGGLRLALSEKGIGPFQSLVFARYMMFFNVYWHHTCRVCTVMLLRAVQEALLAGALSPGELERVDDSTLLALLQTRAASGSASADLAARLRSRTLYKRALEYVADDLRDGESPYALLAPLKRDAARRRGLELAICERLSTPARRLRGHEILIDIPDQKAFRLNMPILRQSAEGLRPRPWDRHDGLDDEIVAALQTRMRRLRIVAADAALRDEVRARELEVLALAREIGRPDLTP